VNKSNQLIRLELSTTNVERKTPEVARWYLFQIPRVGKDEADGQPAGEPLTFYLWSPAWSSKMFEALACQFCIDLHMRAGHSPRLDLIKFSHRRWIVLWMQLD
jgi:hypothetical protein